MPSAATEDVVTLRCPRCDVQLEIASGTYARCPECQQLLHAQRFNPPPKVDQAARPAMPDDAVCVHHPGKQAVHVCAGSGDYICQLCSVEIEGETYSAQYLEAGGQKLLSEAFDRTLPRPDRAVIFYLLLCVPFFYLAPLLLPLALYNFYRMFRLRATMRLYRQLVGIGRVIGLLALIASVVALIAAAFVGFVL